MSTHTPGPWTLEESTPGDGHHYIMGADDSWIVAPDDGWNSGYRDYETRLANAHLIAAAPDLLAACRAFIAADPAEGYSAAEYSALKLMHAAIAKAEGKGQAA